MRALLTLLAVASLLFGQEKKAPPEYNVFVGTYTRPLKSKGIYAWRFQPATGKLTSLGLAVETTSPSYLAVHPSQRFLYAVNEVNSGMVSAFEIEEGTGRLKPLNQVPSKGSGPCHLTTDRQGKWLYVANYNNGSVAAFPIHDDGSLGESSAFVQHTGSSVNPQRQRGPHAHDTVISPDGRYVFVADLGLDQVLGYRVDAGRGGMATEDPAITKLPPGTGPRHLAFRPDGRFLYVLSEMLCNVTAFRYDAARGTTEEIQTVPTLPADYSGTKSGAEIMAHRSGNYLYASNRGHDTIAMFRIDLTSGKLAPIGNASTRGKTPRGFGIDPTGNWLFAGNQDSDNMTMFRIDLKTGNLSPVGDPIEVSSPVCVVFSAIK
ncbi:MAG TPA: lactonase family protein [Candidatus Acidoferrales bacterium]|nr:lactonase family protein [Candidatus Acidoferrales bacterium]HTS67275.1 lactonase family protein [Candidatus Acidoferrales bacterium]